MYPGEENVMIALTPGGTVCSDVTVTDTSCTTAITGDCNYNISLTLSNNVGPSQLATAVFDCKISL